MNGSRGLTWGLLVVCVAACVVPAAVVNYGIDGDAWRGIVAAKGILETGLYYPSRAPGAPLFEFILTGLVWADGHILCNGFTFFSFLAAIVAFNCIALERPRALGLTFLFGLTPILCANAGTAMDYAPGLALCLGGYCALRRGRTLTAFVLVGMAAGFRLTNICFAGVFALRLLIEGADARKTAVYVLWAAFIGALWYIPSIEMMGPYIFRLPTPAYTGLSYALMVGYKSIMALGPLATLCVLYFAVTRPRLIMQRAMEAFRAIGTRLQTRSRRTGALSRNTGVDDHVDFVVEIAIVCIFTLLFIMRCDESEYLIPALPFLYLCVDRFIGRREFAIFFVAVLSFGLVTLEFKGGESGARRIVCKVAPGIVLQSVWERQSLEELRDALGRVPVREKAVILHGFGPMLSVDNPRVVRASPPQIGLPETGAVAEPNFMFRLPGREVYFLHGATRDAVRALREAGFTLYYFSDSAPGMMQHTYGYHPESLGMTKIEVSGRDAFFRANKPSALRDSLFDRSIGVSGRYACP